MPTKDPRIDAYIARSADFAKPVLRHLRQLIHRGCPEAEETLKWGRPTFTYKGILCGMAAFKEHCALGFWKGRLIVGNNEGRRQEAMGQFGRITSLRDLPTGHCDRMDGGRENTKLEIPEKVALETDNIRRTPATSDVLRLKQNYAKLT